MSDPTIRFPFPSLLLRGANPAPPAIACVLALLSLFAALLAPAFPLILSAGELPTDPVAHWEKQRLALDIRIDRVPQTGANILFVPLGSPPPAAPTRLNARSLQAVVEKIAEYSEADSPDHLDAVILEINATGDLYNEDIETLGQLIDMLQVHDYPVFAWINGTACDAAAWIALSCDRIYMAPGATLGGAPPDPLRDDAEARDTGLRTVIGRKADIARDIARSKGWNSDLARAMADGNLRLRHATLDGRPYVLADDTLATLKKLRPEATIVAGAGYKRGVDRLILSADAASQPEIGLCQGIVSNTADLYQALGLRAPHPLHLTLRPPPNLLTAATLTQTSALALVTLLALFLLVCELLMEMKGYATIAAAGVLSSYLTWAYFETPLGPPALGLYVLGVAAFVVELWRPTRRGRLGTLAFAAIGLALALTLIHDAPYVAADWQTHHLHSEFWPTLQNAGLVVGGATLAATALGAITMARLRRTSRYSRRWRKRYDHWDDSLYLELQRQVGARAVTLTPIQPPAPPATAGPAAARKNETMPSVGRISIAGRQFDATCTGAIAAGMEVAVVDATEQFLIVRLVENPRTVVPPWVAPSKYEEAPAPTKYTVEPPSRYGDKAEQSGTPASRYSDLPAQPPEVQSRYVEAAKTEPSPLPLPDVKPDVPGESLKYPPKSDPKKYPPKTDQSKYTPPGGTPTVGDGR